MTKEELIEQLRIDCMSLTAAARIFSSLTIYGSSGILIRIEERLSKLLDILDKEEDDANGS